MSSGHPSCTKLDDPSSEDLYRLRRFRFLETFLLPFGGDCLNTGRNDRCFGATLCSNEGNWRLWTDGYSNSSEEVEALA